MGMLEHPLLSEHHYFYGPMTVFKSGGKFYVGKFLRKKNSRESHRVAMSKPFASYIEAKRNMKEIRKPV